MASLMSSEDLHREVGQRERERQWDTGQGPGEKERHAGGADYRDSL